MKQATHPKPTSNPAKCGHELPDDQPVGRFRVRAGDLVLVADPHLPRRFLAEITGFYKLHRTIYARLGSLPGSDGPVARQSTKVRNIIRAWRLAGRAKTSKEGQVDNVNHRE